MEEKSDADSNYEVSFKSKMKKKELKDIYTGQMYVDDEVLAAAPRNKVQGAIETFKVGKYISCDELEKEYESRGLIPADLFALGAWCEENQKENGTYYATQWKDKDGKWCYAGFLRWNGGFRRVSVFRDSRDWDDDWLFAGVRKSGSTKTSNTETSALGTLDLELAIKMVKDAGYRIFKEV